MIRVGVVEYTNTLPLADGLERLMAPVSVVPGTPRAIADGLERGDLDVGLVPVATLAAHPEWRVVPNLGIACEGEVRSVLLTSRVPLEQIHTLVLDPASRTSNVLARLWLLERLGREVEVVEGPPDADARLALGDAAVVIGDAALFGRTVAPVQVDLGEAWTTWTGLPFVFAVWAGPGAGDPEVIDALEACHRSNIGRIGALADQAAAGDPIRRDLVQRYLTNHIRYRLGERESRGLREYLSRGARAGLLPGTATVVSHATTV